MIKWLAVNDDDMIRAISDSRDVVVYSAMCESINDVQQGFTPDEYRYVRAEYVGNNVKNIVMDCLEYGYDDIYTEENWREV